MENSLEGCFCHQQGGTHIDNYPSLNVLLPAEYSYVICVCKNDSEKCIKSRFHVNCFTKEQVRDWIEKFSHITKLRLATEENCTSSTQVIHSKCQCSLRETCPTMLKISINSNDIPAACENQNVLNNHPATVIFLYTHKTTSDDIGESSEFSIELELIDETDIKSEISNDHLLSYDFGSGDYESVEHSSLAEPNELSPNLEQFVHKKLYYLFEKDYSPQQAYSLYKKELHETFAKDHPNSDDKNERPCLKWVCKQYYAFLEEKHGVKILSEDTNVPRSGKRFMTAPMEKRMKSIDIPVKFNKNEGPLGQKINELCNKYVPILPANNTKKIYQPDISIVSLTPSIDSNNTSNPGANSLSSSYIIKFNSEEKTDKLNLYPLKLIPNVVKNEFDEYLPNFSLPEMKITMNSTTNECILEVIGVDRTESQGIPIPSGVDGVIILTGDQGTLKQNFPQDEITDLPNNQTSPDTKKQRRKSIVKYEDPDEIVFTDNLEDLRDKNEPPQRYSKRKLHGADVEVQFVSKKQKVILPRALDGIENVICLD